MTTVLLEGLFVCSNGKWTPALGYVILGVVACQFVFSGLIQGIKVPMLHKILVGLYMSVLWLAFAIFQVALGWERPLGIECRAVLNSVSSSTESVWPAAIFYEAINVYSFPDAIFVPPATLGLALLCLDYQKPYKRRYATVSNWISWFAITIVYVFAEIASQRMSLLQILCNYLLMLVCTGITVFISMEFLRHGVDYRAALEEHSASTP